MKEIVEGMVKMDAHLTMNKKEIQKLKAQFKNSLTNLDTNVNVVSDYESKIDEIKSIFLKRGL